MYLNQKIVALIPARGGSKGIPQKNIKDLAGNPLIYYTIDAAKRSNYIDEIFVSTDDMRIADVARNYGAKVPCLRPREFAQDMSSTVDVVLHALNAFFDAADYYALVLLQPTQPLRTNDDIDKSIELFFENDGKSLVSISEVNDHPLLMRYLKEDFSLSKIIEKKSNLRRQDMEKVYRVNGAIYINKISEINEFTSFNDNVTGFLMERDHSVDIDELSDLALAEYYMTLRAK